MSSTSEISKLFSHLPNSLRNNLEKHYLKLKLSYAQKRYESSELNGGKFCEVVLRILQWHTSPSNTYTLFGEKIRDFGRTTRSFEPMTGFPESVRFHIPKILNALYTIRNKRSVGHTGGDVDPNYMDATFIVAAVNWIMAELIRIFHNVSTAEAHEIVEAVITKQIPLVWEVAGRKRVLDAKLNYFDRTLVFLYDSRKPLSEKELVDWTEYTNASVFRKNILKPLHKKKLVEYDVKTKLVHISPHGMRYVEDNIKLSF